MHVSAWGLCRKYWRMLNMAVQPHLLELLCCGSGCCHVFSDGNSNGSAARQRPTAVAAMLLYIKRLPSPHC